MKPTHFAIMTTGGQSRVTTLTTVRNAPKAKGGCQCGGRCGSRAPQPKPRARPAPAAPALPPFDEQRELERYHALMTQAESAATPAEQSRLLDRAETAWGLIALHREKAGREAAVLFNARASREGWIRPILEGAAGESVLDG